MSLFSAHEKATAATAVAGDDILYVLQPSSAPVLKKVTPAVLTAGGVVDTTATTLTITQATHGNRTVTISSAAPIAITLPQATGTGSVYRFQMQVVATATSHTIKV